MRNILRCRLRQQLHDLLPYGDARNIYVESKIACEMDHGLSQEKGIFRQTSGNHIYGQPARHIYLHDYPLDK